MKLLELRLLAFGSFTGRSLDFSRSPGLHLIYGPNEAGKSTTLRAITGLLYGIPATTLDAHRHAMSDLRIGARLSDGNGTEIEVVRRKGLKNTLLDAAQNPIDEAALHRLLGGVSEALFRTMFGLDHESLRAGGEALLRGQGDVGESLFDAGVGGPGIHAVLEELRREAEAIFKPKGQNPQLNQAITAYKDAERRSRDSGVRAEAWFEQQQQIEAARHESAELQAERRRLGAEQARLQRATRVLPLLAKRRVLSARRQELGDVPALAADAAERRVNAEREAERCALQIERIDAALGELRQRREALAVPEALDNLADETAVSLQNRLGAHRSAAIDLPKRRADVQGLENEMRALLRDLGRDFGAAEIEGLRLPTATQTRLRSLAKQLSGLETALANAGDALAERLARLGSLRAGLDTLPPATDTSALERALESARRAGDLDAQIEATELRLRAAERTAQRKWQTVRRALHAPRPTHGRTAPDEDFRCVTSLALPGVETIDRFAANLQAIERDESELRARERDLGQRAAVARRAVEELQLQGDVPTEAQLERARQERDALWRELRNRLARPAEARAAAKAFEPALHAADAAADRLRREAERAGKLAALVAAHHEVEEQQRLLESERIAIDQRRTHYNRAWDELWETPSIRPRSPLEMRAWIGDVGALIELAEQIAAMQAEVERLEKQRTDLAADLGAALKMGNLSIAKLCQAAEAAVRRGAQAAAERSGVEKSIADLEAGLAVLEQKQTQASAQIAAWREQWAAAVTGLGLDGGATVEEAEAVLDKLASLLSRADDSRRLRERIAAMERDAKRLQDDVAKLLRKHAPHLGELPFEQAAELLLRDHRAAREKLQRRTDIDADIADKERERAELAELAARAGDALRLLQRAAGADSADALAAIEARAVEAARLTREIEAAEQDLLDAGEGAGIDDLVAQTRDVDPDSARARLRDIGAELERLDEELNRLLPDIGGKEKGLEILEGRTSAAEAAAEAQEHAAAIRAHLERYLRARLAVVLLEQEIERYRQENQGPILRRANELFPRLTLDAYRALKVGFDTRDEGVLLAVRSGDGKEVGVEGLSDGTRDQLYLALRLASLERYLQQSAAMPIVLDDILIHFDDDRARAALAVLGELAQTAQVLFFTHHARLLELAREVVPARVEHNLGGVLSS